MKYWHEISDEEFDRIHDPKAKRTWNWVRKHYKAPDWCNLRHIALDALGCWSLIDKDLRKEITKDFCKDCDESKFYRGENK